MLLAQIFQHSPLIFISKQDSGIISPYELVGKTVMYDPTSDSALLHAILLESLGRDAVQKIKQQSHSMQYEDLVNGKVDVISAYLTDQPFRLKRRGVEVASRGK